MNFGTRDQSLSLKLKRSPARRLFITYIYIKAFKTPTQTYPAGLEAESSSISMVCGWVGGGGSYTINTLVCASSEDSREYVPSLESADFVK